MLVLTSNLVTLLLLIIIDFGLMKKIILRIDALFKKPQFNQFLFFFMLSASLLIHLICMTQGRLLVEEAYYWNYAQHLDWSYLDHPPMVALLIKAFTSLFANYEVSVRAASLFCWCITSFFSYRLCELLQKKSGPYAIFILAIVPFFFFQSIIITPDVPLIAAWSACLYFLYRALILNEAHAWYGVGLCLGLGLLSKYTICLVAFAALVYVLSQPKSRFWLRRKEPYLGVLITSLLFTPVLYWNAQHDWVSFIFQSSRRFNSTTSINTHELVWLVIFFITPMGVWGLIDLVKKNPSSSKLAPEKISFLRYFTFTPLLFFTFYSLNHEVNFNWSGPLFLALLPWLAFIMANHSLKRTLWFCGSFLILVSYTMVVLMISFNQSDFIQQKILLKLIAWDDLTQQFNALADKQEKKTHQPVIFIPLDSYPISSELAFYQQLLLKKGLINKSYPSIGAHIFNRESLMYRYWNKKEPLSGAQVILIAKEAWRFDDPEVNKRLSSSSKLRQLWSHGQGQQLKNIPYYYKIATIKDQ